jgi:Co/Zn/Cd efflux system component
VIVGGTLVLLFGWMIVDPLITLLIAGYVLWHAGREIGGVIRVLMQGAPPGIDTREVLQAMTAVDGVEEVHHLHLWQMEEDRAALEAHLRIAAGRWDEADAIKARVKERLSQEGIGHATLELECARHGCDGARKIGH